MKRMNQAGAGAGREYERRRARDQAAAKRNLGSKIIFILGGSIAVYNSGRVALPLDASHEPSLAAAVLVGLYVGKEAFGARRSTTAFRTGAEGEEHVGARLDRLQRRGYVVLHDVTLRGWGNIDHLVVGPGGVFTVETKNVAGKVRLTRPDGRLKEHVEQAARQARAIADRLGGDPRVPVIALLCYRRAEIVGGLFVSNVVAGVRVVGSRGAVRAIAAKRGVLTEAQVARVVRSVERGAESARGVIAPPR